MLLKMMYNITMVMKKAVNKVLIIPGLKKSLFRCGNNVKISYNSDFKPPKNISIGNNCFIGPNALIWTLYSKVIIGNYVLIGPNVTIITGDHRTDVVGKFIYEVSDKEKISDNDQDVIIEDGVWIGSNVTILKGVTIGKDSIISAGSVVTKSIEPHSIYGGVPAKKIKDRFSQAELEQHIYKLSMR